MNVVIFLLVVALIGIIFAIYEYRNTVMVGPDEPFLHGDYDEKKDKA